MSTKQTLHNFVTIGTAQHRRTKDGDLGYVKATYTSNSVFLSQIDTLPEDNLEQREEWIQGKINLMSHKFKTYSEVYFRYREFTDLLDEFKGNKKDFITKNFLKLRELPVIEGEFMAMLWDNLIYLAVTDQSGLLSETIVNLLTIDHIATALKNDGSIIEDETKLARLENANVLIPGKILTLPKTVVSKSEEPEVPFSKALADQLIIATQNRQIKELEEAKEAIERAIGEYSDAVTQELDDHMKSINDLIETERSGNGYVSDSSGIGFDTSSTSESSESSQPQASFNNTGLGFLNSAQFANIPSVQNLAKIASSGNVSSAVKAQISSFAPTTQLNASFVQNSTNAKVANTFSKFAANAGSNLATVPGLIGSAISNKMQSMGQLMVASQKVIKVGNTAVSLPDKPTEDMFAVILKETTAESGKYALHITQYFKAKASEALEFNVTVTDPDETDHTENNSKPDFTNDHYTTFVLFEDGIEFDDTAFGSATGTVKLRNGKTINFNFSDLKVDDVFMAKPNYGTNTLDENNDSPKLYGVSKIGIAVFRRVEQELKQYVLGEIADVNTTEAGSYKNRKVKYLNRKTKFSESSSLTAKEISSELASSSSLSISEEAQSSYSQTSNKDSGFSAGVSGKLGPAVEFSADGYMNMSSSNSSEESNRLAVEQAKEVSQTITERITSEIQKLRSTEVISEREETVEVGFDHTKATEDRTSIFRWVDKVLENKVVNYGKRLMYEFMIPEPALNFKASLQSPDSSPSDVIILEKPKSPKELGLNSPNDLNLQNYLIFASAYAAEVDEAPMAQLNVGKGESLSGSGDGLHGYHHMKSFDITIPEGYECYQVSWSAGLTDVDGDQGWPEGTLDIGARGWKVWPQCIQNVHNAGMWGSVVSETLPVSLRTKWAGAINVNVLAHCRPTDKLMNTWKLETYNAIQTAYEQKVRAFNASLEDTDKEDVNDISVSSYIARSIEKRELTRAGIEMITEPFKINTARNNYRSPSLNNVSKINKTLGFERHASHVKFLEQAFEWSTMAYKFYPYYWADESKWHEMMNTTNKGDIIFQSFLQSGMARTVVPVRPGFEKAVMFYMETGLIWNGQGYTLDHDDDLYLSITEELIEPEGEVEETWESRVPTNFRVINTPTGPFGADGILEL